MDVLAVVAVCSVVQSLFGIGLLVFGTPTLLLLGYGFPETLATLLPASIAISLLQIHESSTPDARFIRSFATWCLPPLAATLAAVLAFDLHASLNLAVALLLVAFVGLRLFPRIGARAAAWVAGRQKPWMALMGVVHGLSNLGGGLLMILAASRHTEKEQIRRMVAFCYACFATVQLTVLAMVMPRVFGWSQLGYVAIASAVFVLIGQRVFLFVSTPTFDRLLTLFAAAYAGLLGLRSAGVL